MSPGDFHAGNGRLIGQGTLRVVVRADRVTVADNRVTGVEVTPALEPPLMGIRVYVSLFSWRRSAAMGRRKS